MQPFRTYLLFAAVALAFASSPPRAEAQWQKGLYLTTAGIDCPPFVFLSAPVTTVATRFGADVFEQFSLGDPGRKLMFMKPELAQPVEIFPRSKDLSGNGGPLSSPNLNDGTVHEPAIYHHRGTDKYWVIFSYANDLVNRTLTKPCEIYAIDITGALGTATTLDANSLPTAIQITHSKTNSTDIFADAFNGGWAQTMWWVYGFSTHFATNTGPCVVDEEHGPVLYYASNERRAGGFGLMVGDLEFTSTDVTLKNSREIQHFGTTSLLSFFETPKGCGGSYASSTESEGQWSLFEFESDEAFWTTASGYFNGTNIVDHNATTVAMGSDPNDSKIALTRYYINNNKGFGSILTVDYDKLGQNSITSTWVDQATILNLFPDIDPNADDDSLVGKFTLPAAGRNMGASAAELFLTYSPLQSNDQNHDLPYYHATLVAITDVSSQYAPRSGHSGQSTYQSPAYDDTVANFWTVLKHDTKHAFAMRPILTHADRFGWNYREVKTHHRPDASWIPSSLQDMPVARVTAGPIYRTDIESYRRRLGSYDPSTEVRNGNADNFAVRISTLTKDIPGVDEGDVWGIRIFITDPRVQRHYTAGGRKDAHDSDWGYLHHHGGGAPGSNSDAIEFERYRHLSDVKAEADGTLSFLLPSNVPVKFFLIHNDGTVLAQHRNHHSFATGQHDNRCTGCHQHDTTQQNFSVSTLTAFQPSYVPFDTMNQTLEIVGWDQNGLVLNTLSTPTAPVPEFKQDIYPILDSNCSTCHNSTDYPSGAGIGKWDLSVATQPGEDPKTLVWRELHQKRWVNRRLGAAMSPLAWIVAGVSNDSVLRLDGEPNSRYKPSTISTHWVTTRYYQGDAELACHGGIAASDAYKVIKWIDAGAAIDHNNMSGGSVINGGGVNYDGYQIALSMRCAPKSSAPDDLVLGFWDVENNLDRIEVTFGSNSPTTLYVSSNGTTTVAFPTGGNAIGFDENVSIVAVDDNGNKSRLEKTYRHLRLEAETHRGQTSLAIDDHTYQPGESMTFTIDAGSAFANASFSLLVTDDLQSPVATHTLNLGIFELPTLTSLHDGTLDANGSQTVVVPISGTSGPIVDLRFMAAVFGSSTVAKTNLVRAKVE